MEINCEIGEAILNAFPEIRVNVHKPDVMLHIEVRDEIYIYSEIIPGPGGMPVGTNGKAMLLLSGGIDSPVAGYMIAKRGVGLEATYFHAPPYTSERAKQKVIDLAKLVSKYSGPITLNIVNFTDIQLYIYDKCPHDELTIIMRRYMMKIAEHFAKESGCLGLITGESIGQVASQTMQSPVSYTHLDVYKRQGRGYSKMLMSVTSTLLIEEIAMGRFMEQKGKLTFLDFVDVAHKFSREVEHSDKNLETLEQIVVKKDFLWYNKLLCSCLLYTSMGFGKAHHAAGVSEE